MWPQTINMKNALPVSGLILALLLAAACQPEEAPVLSRNDAFLDTLQKQSFYYFWDQANPRSGLVPDRVPSAGTVSPAAIGFALASYLVGAERDFITRADAGQRTLVTLQYLLKIPQDSTIADLGGYRGFYFQQLDGKGRRATSQTALSTLQTGMLMAGLLACQTYFDYDDPFESNIRYMADSLYRRVEWDWATRGQNALALGWRPEQGFLPGQWQGYNESLLLMALALGSPSHPVPDELWDRWRKDLRAADFQGQTYLQTGPMSGDLLALCWLDGRGNGQGYADELDLFENARRHLLGQRAYCEANPGGFAGYSEQLWGLSECDGPGDTTVAGKTYHGYWARGATAARIQDDGTLAPVALTGAVPFAPAECLAGLKHLDKEFGPKLRGQYGFKNAFNLSYPQGWFATDYLAVHQGLTVLQIENYRNEFMWRLLRQNPYVREGLGRMGFNNQ